MASDQQTVCAYPGCGCRVSAESGVSRDGKPYCCEGCAEGRGCECENCGCAAATGTPAINPPR